MAAIEKSGETSTLTNPEGWLMHALGAQPTSSGARVGPDTAMRCGAVFACVRYLAETIASLPLHVYRRLENDGKEKARDHSLYRVLHDRPNPWQTAMEFRELLVGHLCLRGKFFASILRRGDGSIDRLIPLHPDRVSIQLTTEGDLVYVWTDRWGKRYAGMQEDVWHVRYIPKDEYDSLSPIGYARESIGLALSAEEFGARIFGAGAVPSGVLQMEGDLKPEIVNQLRAEWMRTYGGAANSNKIAVLGSGAKYEKISMTSEDAQFLETRKFQRTEIAAIFRVPPYKIGDLERATHSNIEQQGLEAVVDTLRPWAVRIEQSAWRDLLVPGDEQDSLFVELDLDGLMRGDLPSRMASYANGIMWGIYCPNECRAKENLNPIEGGDEYLKPANMLPLTYNPIVSAANANKPGSGTQDPPPAKE